jgi:hypothetical protein
VFDVDWMGMLGRELLRERGTALIAETCAWAVGMSDQPHYARRSGRVAASGLTVGERAADGRSLGGDEDGRLDLGDAPPGSFQDALNSLAPDGRLHADRFDEEVLTPFVRDTFLQAAERARTARPQAWAELADDLGEDEEDPAAVVRAGGWEAPLRIDAEHLVLAALGGALLIQVEAEGLPLSLVRAAEAEARNAAPAAEPDPPDDGLAGARFLASTALGAAGLTLPVRPAEADDLLAALLAEGLEIDEVTAVLPDLPIESATAAAVTALIDARRSGA